MSYVLTLNKTAVDIPVVPGDQYPEDSTANNYMFSSFSGGTYIVDLTLTLFEEIPGGEEPILEPEPITSFSITTPGRSGVTFTTISSTSNQRVIRASGTLNDAVFNSTYDLVLPPPPGSQQYEILRGVSAAGTLPPYLAVVRWTPPTIFVYEYVGAYSIIVNSGQVSEMSRTLSQFSYWGWQSGIASFQVALNAGSL